jgi:lipopolysaccharide heptosyltransferase II
MVPSARWRTKRWPAEKFAELITKMSCPSILAGSGGDRDIAHDILTQSGGHALDLCGRTSLKELAALIEGARAVISNDSGPMHIAAALGVPTVALFGPTDPEKTGPYGWKSDRRLKVIRTEADCSPCRNRECGDFRCMESITVDAVHGAVKEFL